MMASTTAMVDDHELDEVSGHTNSPTAKAMAKDHDHHTPSARLSFLSLPYEIRRMIYGEFFVTKTKFFVTDPHPCQVMRRSPFPAYFLQAEQWGLLLSCRAINDEITTMVYGENCFHLTPTAGGRTQARPWRAESCLKHLRPETAMITRDIGISLLPRIESSFVNLLDSSIGRFPQLRVIVVLDEAMPG